ncbi:Replication factor C subunit 2 [Neolecta irregularis DAH-3]|uniref:Replication factor C subunit 2 n=1 Tax=Neolecta irregularis (strain DAH-3) TaxID=1198029 RepID=A0A1U7LWA8_NEOID|nr:Replication factor C subunit 2 [Neolecta irregularis DAH-3]|eukprot:OLL26966.1 Replication factor C subunit 2 [Neolecta irregularis DAH-3]
MSFFDTKARTKPTKYSQPTQVPWVEKYRPKNLSEISAQEHTINVLKRTLNSSNLPHMLFYGPPGTGKTSTILALAKELYGPEQMKSRVLELNASDERGISIVREKVKDFAKMAVSNKLGNEYPCPPFKIIILDEADSMTQDAQSALRRTMETYSKITRFCLICNYVTRIIEPLASRCSKFRFKPLDSENSLSRLSYIANEEHVGVGKDTLETLVRVSEGDLRKSITYLQSATKLQKAMKGDMEVDITSAEIIDIAGVIPESVLRRLLEVCSKGKGIVEAQTMVEEVVMESYSCGQLISQLHDKIIQSSDYTEFKKCRMIQELAETDKRLTDGADEHLQALDLISQFRTILAN